MTDNDYRELDIRERLVRIDHLLADHDRKRQEIRIAPWQMIITSIAATTAVFIAGAAVGGLIVRLAIGI
jgi:hypothetical protein